MIKIIDKIVFSFPFLLLMAICWVMGMGALVAGEWIFLPFLIVFISFILYTTHRMKVKNKTLL